MAGLDPEDVATILAGERGLAGLRQQALGTVLGERARRERIAREERIRREELKAAAEQRLAKSMKEKREAVAKIEAAKQLQKNKIALEQEKSRLIQERQRLDPAARAIKEREIAIKEQELDIKEQELATGKKLTPTEQISMAKQVENELASTAAVDVEGNEIPFEERRVNALAANNRPGNPVYYRITEPVETGLFDLALDKPGEVTPIQLPRNPSTRAQVTSQDIIDTMAANPGMTEEDVLRAIGAI